MPGSANFAWVEGVSPGLEGKRFQAGPDGIHLGRGSTGSIPILDPLVSREHAEVRFEGGDFAIVDLGSTHGTWVNGVRVQRAVLADGARIRLGSTEFVFRLPQDAIPTAMLSGEGASLPASVTVPPAPVALPSASSPSGPAPMAAPGPAALRPAIPPAPPNGAAAKPKRRSKLLIGCGSLALLAVCGCAGIYFLAVLAGSSSGLSAAINRGLTGGGEGFTEADLALALAAPSVDERPQILENFGRPDEFDISVVQVEGGVVRLESWRYYGFGTRVDFVDGVIVWTIDLEPAPEGSIFPAWYDPTAFQTGMTPDDASALLTTTSPAGTVPETIDLADGGQDLTGSVLLVGDQIAVAFENGRLVHAETLGVWTGEGGG